MIKVSNAKSDDVCVIAILAMTGIFLGLSGNDAGAIPCIWSLYVFGEMVRWREDFFKAQAIATQALAINDELLATKYQPPEEVLAWFEQQQRKEVTT